MDAQGTTPFEEVAAAYTTRLDSAVGRSTLLIHQRLRRRRCSSASSARMRCFPWAASTKACIAHRIGLNYRLRSSGQDLVLSGLRVIYRPRSTLRALVKQMYETGTWRREVVRRYPETATLRY